MADGQPLILGQANQATQQTSLSGGDLVVDGFQANGPIRLGASPQSVTTINGHQEIVGSLRIRDPDGALSIVADNGILSRAKLALRNAGTIVIPDTSTGITFPLSAPTGTQGLAFIMPHSLFNGSIAARVVGQDVIVELSHRPNAPLECSWMVVERS